MKIHFLCSVCERPSGFQVPSPTRAEWQCVGCDHRLPIPAQVDPQVSACLLCGGTELYKKKDFPHWLGMSILIGACLGFLVLNLYRWQWWAWGVLLGSALVDGALYCWVRDAVVCYRCGAHYRDLTAPSNHEPHDLGIAERYRQERLRREQMQG